MSSNPAPIPRQPSRKASAPTRPTLLLCGASAAWADELAEYLHAGPIDYRIVQIPTCHLFMAMGRLPGRAAVILEHASEESLRQMRSARHLRAFFSLVEVPAGDHGARERAREAGADICVTAPAAAHVIEAHLARHFFPMEACGTQLDPEEGRVALFGSLALWAQGRKAQWNGLPLNLTGFEFGLLDALAHAGGRPVSRQQLHRQTLGDPVAAQPLPDTLALIDIVVRNVVAKLEATTLGRATIRTEASAGYRLVCAPA